MDLLKNIANVIREQKVKKELPRENRMIKTLTAVILGTACIVMSVFNLVRHFDTMLVSTIFLAVGFYFCACLSGLLKKILPYKIIMSVLIMSIFTFYTLNGSNEGFAILWIVLIPLFSMIVIDLNIGTLISGYFFILIVVLFYTPLKSNFYGVYTSIFMARFPVLYLLDYMVSFLIICQKEANELQFKKSSYIDDLTFVGNRRLYNQKMKEIAEEGYNENLFVFLFDINELKNTNDEKGHHAGDELIRGAVDCIKKAFDGASLICRKGGDEFLVAIDAPKEEVKKMIASFDELIENWKGKFISHLSVAYGYACWGEHQDNDLFELEIIADNFMYADKEEYYTKNNKTRRK